MLGLTTGSGKYASHFGMVVSWIFNDFHGDFMKKRPFHLMFWSATSPNAAISVLISVAHGTE